MSSTTTIYVGNLDQRVTDTMLLEYFAPMGSVANIKIVAMHRHGPFPSVNYGFVEYVEPQAADSAIQELNGCKVLDYEIKVNWAQQGQQLTKEEAPSHFQIFIGDLAPEITDDLLSQAFGVFGTMVNAHVMRDTMSGNSRGFGFVAFREKADADQAIASMNGEMVGSRNIRVNWATQKSQSDTPPPRPGQQLPYETVLQQTPAYVTSVYVGNLPPNTTDNDLLQPFQRFGFIQEVKLQADRGFAFVKLDTHQNAANSIVHLQGMNVNGREAKLSWGKDRAPSNWPVYNSGYNNGGQQQQQQRQQSNNWRQDNRN
ncbi:uncharacterized protein EV154DRAFT_510674 [Mucor mucedo]|uniref:RRM domain-containing protein n=1 Tax=Mucor saturninus TaxID=64648 RepID=A0A8H7V0J9_9FUNG|nr:uncharacterized protein EV154DRAFT_510674 [Mucor mucedo]KAG2198908.1 hypothetical protein INT47_010313 [Mucor saturninus]KAI7890694.1 hypothetical protein EV154DRAFT_510674 [Mucor mucedo]